VRYYHSQGYRHADGAGSVERQGGGFLLRFQISEGPRSVLVNVTFDGNQFFKSERTSRNASRGSSREPWGSGMPYSPKGPG
jgi:outer membrane protein assembly factor BamA